VTSAGGTYSAGTLAAVSAFCTSAKANNYWAKLSRINLFCGYQLAAALVPLKVGSGNATDTNIAYVAGDYTESTGLTGNGSTSGLDTGVLADSLTATNLHLAVYNRSSTANGSGQMGLYGTGADSTCYIWAPYSDSVVYSYMPDNATAATSSTLATPYGMVLASRTAANSHIVYRNGVNVGESLGTSSGTLPAGTILVGALGDVSAPSAVSESSDSALGAYSIGSGLTPSEAAAYYADMQAFQTALGRNV
jgi:hypothetical protein